MTIQLFIFPQNKEIGFFASTSDRLIRMEYIRLILEIWLEFQEAKIASVSSYNNGKLSLAQIVSFEDIEIGKLKKSFKVCLTLKDDLQRIDFYDKDICE